MKRFSYVLSATLLVTGIPLLVSAQFQGPPQSPPNGNVPGVIWNTAGTNVQQTGAQINIDGDVNSDGSVSAKGDITGNDINAGGDLKSTGDLITRSVTTTWNHNNGLFGDLLLQPGKAFHIDQNGSATFYLGNWYGGSSKPLSLYLNGDLQVSDLGLPPAQGNRGRIQATQFCFHPGAASDCITSWALNSGLYVQKVGDAMTGALSITVPASATGLTVSGGTTGGSFNGSTYGLSVQSLSASGAYGTAVHAYNANIGGDLNGNAVGLQASGGNYGAYISSGSQYGTWLSYPGYGTYVTVPATSNYGLYVNAASGLAGSGQQSAIYADVPLTTLGISTAGRLEAVGDLDVAGNKWGGVNSGNFTTRYQQSVGGITQWTDYVPSSYKCATKNSSISSSGFYTCPNGTYMGGVQVNASQQVVNLVCCTL